MGANQSQDDFLSEEEDNEDFVDAQPSLTPDSGKFAASSSKVRLYRHVGGVGPSGKWELCKPKASSSDGRLWKFSQLGSREEREEEEGDEDSAWKEKAAASADVDDSDWFLVIGSVAAKVDSNLRLKLNDDQMRGDFVGSGGVWALKFSDSAEYRQFVSQHQDCLFENLYHLKPTPANRLKVVGKDFVQWAEGEDGDETMWDADDTFQPPPAVPASDVNLKATWRGTPSAKGAQSLSMGAFRNSYLLHGSGLDVFLNAENGLDSEGYAINLRQGQSGDANSFLTPKKGMLMRAETNMMLLTPAQSTSALALRQLDIESGQIVASWQFQKDGTDISIKDISNDSKSAQLDGGESTFLGLDDNRLCRWDTRDKHGAVQTLATPSPSPVLTWQEGHQFSRGTNFTCFASTGDGAIAVGSRDGKVRLYSGSSMRMAKTAFPGLGSPITNIDVTFDGKWILATCDTYLLVISTVFRDRDGREKTGFEGRMGSNIAAPRLLKLNPVDAHAAGSQAKFQGAHFSWVTDQGRHERNIVASVGQYSVIWNFRRVKLSEHQCYKEQEGLKTCYCYKIVPRESAIVDSKFMHDNFLVSKSPEAPLVVATPVDITSYNV